MQSTHAYSSFVAAGSCLMLLLFAARTTAQGPDLELTRLTHEWRSRQNRVMSLRLEWEEVQTKRRAPSDSPDSLQPVQEESTSTFRKSVIISGDWIRYRYEATANPQPGNTVSDTSYDGVSSVSFSPPDTQRNYPVGFIHPPHDRLGVANVHVKPIKLCFRPFDPNFEKIEPTSLERLPESAIIGGNRCLGVRVVRRSGTPELVLWTRPDLAYVVVRCSYAQRGTVKRQIDIEYDVDPSFGPVPTAWRVAHYGPANVITLSTSAKVVSYQINPPLSRDDFQILFPIGTMVTDTTGPEAVDYVIQRDNPRRLISEAEIRGKASYENLLTTEPGQALVSRSKRPWKWWFMLGIACFFTILVVASWRYVFGQKHL